VLGPNGAGKSTLLRVLATARPPSAGELRLLGRSALPPDPALRRHIGYAGDTPVHIDALSGRENALLFARAAGLDPGRASEAVGRLLDRLGLAEDADRPAGGYSHGMRRKLLLAEALAHEPAIVLLDEPTLGLDPPSRDALAALLRERADAGATVVLATHDTRLAESLCDRVLLLHQGSVAAEGTPTELIRRLAPTTRVVVELRNPPRVPPTLEGARTAAATRDRLVVEAGAGTAVLPALCEALLAAGAEIASIRVREPGLAEAFLTLTGSDLDPVHR
jgi:ABC-type multidrug transport system ATPase subunit